MKLSESEVNRILRNKDNRKKLEKILTTAISNFEKDTGMMVRKVNLMRLGEINSPIDIIQVDTV